MSALGPKHSRSSSRPRGSLQPRHIWLIDECQALFYLGSLTAMLTKCCQWTDGVPRYWMASKCTRVTLRASVSLISTPSLITRSKLIILTEVWQRKVSSTDRRQFLLKTFRLAMPWSVICTSYMLQQMKDTQLKPQCQKSKWPKAGHTILIDTEGFWRRSERRTHMCGLSS